MATALGVMALILWSVLALLGNLTADVSAFQLLSLCFFIAALLMPIKRIMQGASPLPKPELTIRQWLFGTIGLFGFHFCYFVALKFAPAIEVSLIVYSWPLLLTLFVATRTTLLSAFIGGVLGFLGIISIVAGGESINVDSQHTVGYLLAICCSVIWSCYSWFLTRSNNSVDDVGWLCLVVAILALVAHGVMEAEHGASLSMLYLPLLQLSLIEWVGVILLGLGPVGGAFYLWDIALKQGNQPLLASMSFGTPLASAIVLALAGLNAWSANIIIALTLILIGAIIANKNLLGRKNS